MASMLNKVAIVTGSSMGIGEAIALMFASKGAKVTLCGRDEERLKSVLDKAVKASGGHKDRFVTVQGDLHDQSIRKKIIEKAIESFGRLDILVNNAGIGIPDQTILSATEETFNITIETNLKAAFFLIQMAVPHLEITKGCIINVSSCTSTLISPEIIVYELSKVALDHLTKCLAVFFGPKGIRINSVNPGFIPTNILKDFTPQLAKLNNALAQIEFNHQPLKTSHLTAEDVARAVTFLASDEAHFLTGENLPVDFGRRFGPAFRVTES